MDLVPIAFLALIFIVSGGIAYFADWLGRKLGKKRLRLGRLRPRHTAALGVVSSGVLISVITTGLMYAFSSDVRQWIREGRKAIRDLNDVRAQRDLADADNKRISNLNARLRSESSQRQAEIDKERGTLASLQGKITGLQGNIASLQKQIGESRHDAILLQGKMNELQKEDTASIRDLHLTENERAVAQKSLADIKKQNESLNQVYHSLNTSYRQLSIQSKEIEDHNAEVTRKNIDLTSNNLSLEQKQKDLEAKIQDATRDLEAKTREVDRQTEELEVQETKIRLAVGYLGKLDVLSTSARTQPLIFSAHEELARVYIAAHMTLKEAEDSITSLLREARATADARGAKGAKGSPSASIYQHEDPKTHDPVSPDEIIGEMVKRVAGKPTDQVLVASSSLNAFEGEPVSLELTAYPNPLVYKDGQVVAEIHIDGRDDERTILSNIDKFLKQKVHDRAKSDHLIPSGDNSFGNVDGAEILKIVKTVQSADRTVRLQAIARGNTRAGDPLYLELRIR